MPEDTKTAKKTILKWYGSMAVLQALLLIFGAGLPWWIRFIPAMLMAAGLVLSGLAILFSYFRLKSPTIYIDGVAVHACMYCRWCRTTPNPIAKSFPVNHCGASPGKPLITNPLKIPWWCRYVGK